MIYSETFKDIMIVKKNDGSNLELVSFTEMLKGSSSPNVVKIANYFDAKNKKYTPGSLVKYQKLEGGFCMNPTFLMNDEAQKKYEQFRLALNLSQNKSKYAGLAALKFWAH